MRHAVAEEKGRKERRDKKRTVQDATFVAVVIKHELALGLAAAAIKLPVGVGYSTRPCNALTFALLKAGASGLCQRASSSHTRC